MTYISDPELDLLDQLIAIRRERGLSTKQTAHRLHVTPSAVSNFERGVNSPTLARILAYAEVVGAEIRIEAT